MDKKILIADYHPIVVDGITQVIETFDCLTKLNKVVVDGLELKNVLSLYYPDVLIIDLSLPNFEGLKDIKSIKRSFKEVKILIFNTENNIALELNCIKAGAAGYLCKTASIDVFRLALERVSNGGIYISEELSRLLSSNKDMIDNNLR